MTDEGASNRAADDLTAMLYDELHRIAVGVMQRERVGHTLQPTALVHEAYVRLAGIDRMRFDDRRAFVQAAAGTIRRVLVDHARARRADKRGGDRQRVTLASFDGGTDAPDLDVVALHEALEALAAIDPRKVRVVELRFFGGMTIPETAETLGVSTTTVDDDWAFARAWLRTRLAEDAP